MNMSLEALRQEIDQIDDGIHDLIMRRSELVTQIRACKPSDKPLIRPEREAIILRRLLNRHQGVFPKSVIVRLWRELIGTFTSLQGEFTALGPATLKNLTTAYYGSLITFQQEDNAIAALNLLSQGQATLAVLPWPNAETSWWKDLARQQGNFFVVVHLPFIEAKTGPRAVVVADIEPQPTGNDKSWIVVPENASLTAFKNARKLAESEGLTLFEVDEFVAKDDLRVGKNTNVILIGGYATPYTF